MVPKYKFLQDSIIEYLNIKNLSHPVVADLGAGSGLFLEQILTKNKTAFCYWIDSSEAFLEIAMQKLASYKDRVEFILSSMEAPWEKQLSQTPNFIFSMSAIHHLENGEKIELYQKSFGLLAPKGWFVNIDEMKTVYDDAYYNSLLYWVRHVDESLAIIPEEKRALYFKWNGHFDDWKTRNIDNFGQPKTKGDDLHEVFTLQMQWLKEAGFINVDVFVKYYLWCIVGGQKPETEYA